MTYFEYMRGLGSEINNDRDFPAMVATFATMVTVLSVMLGLAAILTGTWAPIIALAVLVGGIMTTIVVGMFSFYSVMWLFFRGE